MYTDPWDLKHSIQEMQEEQKQSKRLISNHKYSSSTFSEAVSEDIQNAHGISLSEYQTGEESNNSDQNSTQYSKTQHEMQEKSTIESTHSGHYENFVQQKPRDLKNRKKYGNMIVFLETKNTILSIGPNYIFFFIAYACFTISAVYLVYLVNTSLESIHFKIGNFAFCALQNLSYLLIAFSNPGVQLPKPDYTLSDKEKRMTCEKCGVIRRRKVYHCKECDVCISDYDHHCPWSSKCIGGGNLKRFYFFVCMTPFYIFYYVVAFMICMASLTLPHAPNMKAPLVAPSL